ncbi:MAG: hypothetical protein II809_02590 [Bacteroidales bacterium]|nr:hypothetical protein [Bacteroidales bacterium]MBQ7575867.1 hypothetical protein [Bacteroidales bacterium]
MFRKSLNLIAATALTALFTLAAASPEASARKKVKAAPAVPEPAKVVTNDKGYYKDIFMDSGIGVSSRKDLPAARYLGLQMEAFISSETAELSAADTILQNELLISSALDENGCLLYPDGAPRFRMVYMNGGNAMSLTHALKDAGRQVFIDFVHGGGSYVGSCAGAFFPCHYKLMDDGVKDYTPEYIGIWPGVVRNTYLTRTPTGVHIEPGSALLRYFDFGGDMYVDEVFHNGGCHAVEDTLWPANGEVLARFDTSKIKTKRQFDKLPVIWSVKEKEEWGRVISCGSHPEGSTYGDRLQLMSAMVLYALDGNAPARVKGSLVLGEPRVMDRATHDRLPEFTRIGDKQYHHFTVDVPEGTDTLRVELRSVKGFEDYELYLFANPGDFAFRENAKYMDISLKTDKVLEIPAPAPGKYFISVFCNTTVTSLDTEKGVRYTGRVDVLNGVPYIVGVNLPAPVEEAKK